VGAWSGVTALAVALGPLAGGFISQHWHWGWIFSINVPLGIIALGAGAAAISESRDRSARRGLDLPGLATSTIALSGLTYALIQGHAAGWTSPAILTAFSVTATAGAAFAAESRSGAPMVDLALFRSRVFLGGTATLVLWGFRGPSDAATAQPRPGTARRRAPRPLLPLERRASKPGRPPHGSTRNSKVSPA